MCGVFGYVGDARSVPQTLGVALKSLEYRGYDSWGMVWREADRLQTVKRIGRVPGAFTFDAMSRIAIGHTRWATHGGVTDANAHPHLDRSGRVAIVHNGIVENARELRALLDPGTPFASETDSEVIAHMLGERVATGVSIVDALRQVFPQIHGQNAVIAIDQAEEVIAAAMNVAPLVIGTGANGSFISSDPFALVGKASQMVIAPNESVIRLGPDGVSACDYSGRDLPLPDAHPVPEQSLDELGGYSHYMTKEMSEQPSVLRAQTADIEATEMLADRIRKADQVILTGCGSAWYAARLGATWLAGAGKRALAIPASEFDDIAPFLDNHTLVIAVSQSGETADILDAMRTARKHGSPLVGLVNVLHSSAARMADHVVPLLAGRERSVLATKSMIAMLGRLLGAAKMINGHADEVPGIPEKVPATIEALANSEAFLAVIDRVSARIAASEHVYIIGKGEGFGVAQEAALKIKEASYVHAEAFAAGELKHGAIALIDVDTPCLVFGTDQRFISDIGASAQELRSRGGYTIGIGPDIGDGVCECIGIPDLGSANALVHIFIAQRIAYSVALLRHLDPDYPRNLAKSVTVK